MKTRLIFFFSILCLRLSAQDPQFSQVHSNSLYLNPAYTGSAIHPVISVSFRNQWPNLTGNYKTYFASYHQYVEPIRGGVGFYYLHDEAGEATLNTDRYNFSYAYHYEYKSIFVVQVAGYYGLINKKIDWSKLTFGDMIDNRYGFVYQTQEPAHPSSTLLSDVGGGILLYDDYFYAGASFEHILEPNQFASENYSGSELPMKMTLNGGIYLPIGDSASNISVNPDFTYCQQRYFNYEMFTLTARYKFFLIGGGIRGSDSGIFFVGLENRFLRISYCYDATTSKLASSSGGSHEFFTSFKINSIYPKKVKRKAIRLEAF